MLLDRCCTCPPINCCCACCSLPAVEYGALLPSQPLTSFVLNSEGELEKELDDEDEVGEESDLEEVKVDKEEGEKEQGKRQVDLKEELEMRVQQLLRTVEDD